MANNPNVSFTVTVKDAASAVLQQIETAGGKVSEKLIGFKDILKDLSVAAGTVSLAVLARDMIDLGAACDNTFRSIAANLPTFTEGIGQLKEDIEGLANATGHSIESLEQSAAGIARMGVANAEELKQQLTAATLLADATGTSVDESAQLLIQLRREFHLTGDQALETAADLASVSQGKIGISEMLSIFQASTPVFLKFGIDADTGTRALGALAAQGLTTSRTIRGELGKLDAQGIKDLAAQIDIASNSVGRLKTRADETEGSTTRLAQSLRNELVGAMEDVGNAATNKASGPIKGLTGLLIALKGLIGDGQWGTLMQLGAGNPLALAQGLAAATGANNASGPNNTGVTFHNAPTLAQQGMGPPTKKTLAEINAEAEARKTAEADEIAAQRERLKGLDEEIKSTQALAAEQRKAQEERKQSDNLIIQVETALGNVTGHAAEAAAAAIDERAAKLKEEIILNTQLTELQQLGLLHDVEITRNIEQAQNAAKPILEAGAETLKSIGAAGHTALGDMTALMALQQQDLAEQKSILAVGGDDKAVKTQLLEIDKKRAEILKQLASDGRTVVDTNKIDLQTSVEHARVIQQAVDGALQLAGAFHLVDQNALNVLRSVGQIAANIPDLVKQISALNAGTAGSSLSGVMGAALPIVGALATIASGFLSRGEDAQAKAILEQHIRAMDSLTNALHDVVAHGIAGIPGGVDRGLTQQGIAIITQMLAGAAGRPGGSGLTAGSFVETNTLQEIAKQWGITIDGTVDGYRQFLSVLEYGLPLLQAAHDAQQKQEQEDLQVRLLRARGLGDEAAALAATEAAQREYTKAVTDGDDALTLAAMAATQAAEAIQGAAESSLKGALSTEDAQAQLDHVTDPTQLFARKAKAYAGAGGSLGTLLGGFDLSNLSAADIASIDASLNTLFKQLSDSPDSVNLAGLSIQDLIAAILDLNTAADTVAKGVVTAAAAMSAAETSLGTDYSVYGTSADKQAVGYAGAIGLDLSSFDLTTQAGVDGAKQAVRDWYTAHKTDTPGAGQLVQPILSALGSIQVPGSAASAAASAGSAASSSSAVAAGFKLLTTVQGDGILDLMRRSLTVQVDQLNFLKTKPGVMGAAASGGVTINGLNVHVTTAAQDAETEGREIGDAIVRELEIKLGRKLIVQQTYRGGISVLPI